MINLYQAEWCPYSAAVRERLTELGVDFVARQVPAWPEQRTELVDRFGTDSIPVLEVDDEVYTGTRAIMRYLEGLAVPAGAAEHRARYHEHAEAREQDASGRLLEKAAPVR